MPSFRAAVAADEAFLLDLAARLADFPLPEWRTADEIARADRAILLDAVRRPDPSTMITVAEDPPGTRIGYVFVSTHTDYFTGEPAAHVEILVVAPPAEGRGVGRELLARAEAWARSRGYRQITLNVFARNRRAANLYDRVGYRPETVRYWKRLSTGDLDPAPAAGG